MSHTPGPWEPIEAGSKCPTPWAVVADEGQRFIGDIGNETDARLIAAAPDLLQTLGVVVQLLREEGFHVTATKAEAVIAKARGEVP